MEGGGGFAKLVRNCSLGQLRSKARAPTAAGASLLAYHVRH